MIDVNLLFDSQEVGFLPRKFFNLTYWRKKREQKKQRLRRIALAALALQVSAMAVLALPAFPYFWYHFFPETTTQLADVLEGTVDLDLVKSRFGEELYEERIEGGGERGEVVEIDEASGSSEPEEERIVEYRLLPPLDPSLPDKNRLKIEKIGIDTQILESEEKEIEEVLRLGVWRVPELGEPEDRKIPMILAAHRFGYLAWSNQYRRENSFFNLPKLENGDRIEVVWNQRKYVYEIYEGYTDDRIRNYDGDIILYTCEVLNSPRRIVRHARLVPFDEVYGEEPSPQPSVGIREMAI